MYIDNRSTSKLFTTISSCTVILAETLNVKLFPNITIGSGVIMRDCTCTGTGVLLQFLASNVDSLSNAATTGNTCKLYTQVSHKAT